MKPETLSRDELHQKLADGATVVTGNSRLAAALQQEFQQRAIGSGLEVWQTADIQAWAIWLRRSWEQAVFEGRLESPELLLTEEQEQYLWQSVIESSTAAILRPEATARKAADAWRQLINWQLDREHADFDGNEDTRAFKAWAEAFEQRCDEQHWLPAACVAQQLLACFKHDEYCLDSEILLLGFDELTPLQQALSAACNRDRTTTGASMRWIQLAVDNTEASQQGSSPVRLACADNDDEIISLAQWIRGRLQSQPESRIGVIMPDLAVHRTALIRHFKEILAPASQAAGADEPLPWNISLGQPLKYYAIIGTAFDVLDLAGGSFSLESTGPLIISPYLAGAAEELGPRALLDRKLRDNGEQTTGLKNLSWLAANSDRPWHAPILAERLNRLQDWLDKVPGSASPADWVKWFAGILASAGWAKDRDYSSGEYQAIESFHKLLARFSGLQAVTGRLSYSRALSILKRLALSQIFQPRSEAGAIQVLGLYEAIGQRFDALWVMDLHDGNWPAAPQANPFIPIALQRRLAMPHADQARELSIAQGITKRLLTAAPQVVMSYPLRKGDEPLRHSPLIDDLPQRGRDTLLPARKTTWSELIHQHSSLIELEHDQAPALQQQRASGGSGIFKYQSLCPFRAFAQYRLSATALATPQVGLDAMKRGQLFHRVLELFWRDVRNLEALKALDEPALEAKLNTVISQAIDGMAEHNPDIFSPRFRQIETSRLNQLSLQWLEIEKQRADFTVVEFEKEVMAEINGIRVHLWIDRIDKLADDRKVIIDYKTGTVNPAQWFGERPEEPQLPLYSLVEGGTGDDATAADISAVLYGQLKAADMKFSGVVEKGGLIPDLPPVRNTQLKDVTEYWPQVLDDWRHTINQLAQDFREGRAAVDPKKPATCETSYCELSGLCRIDELLAATDDD